MLALRGVWPGMMRTLHGDHERFESAYFAPYKGYYFTGDGCRRDADGHYWCVAAEWALRCLPSSTNLFCWAMSLGTKRTAWHAADGYLAVPTITLRHTLQYAPHPPLTSPPPPSPTKTLNLISTTTATTHPTAKQQSTGSPAAWTT